MPPERSSLIISTYESPAALDKVLGGVAAQSRAPDEILIADDGSKAPTAELIQRWRERLPGGLTHVWHEDAGFRKTMILNKAVAAAQGDHVIFLDGDCVPHKRFIEDHRALVESGYWVQGRRCFVEEKFVAEFDLERTPKISWMLGGKITGVMKALRWPVPVVRRNRRQRGIIGCNMAFWREDLLAVNGLDEEYAGWGIGEDSDLGTRLYHLGRKRKFVYGRAIVFHLNHRMAPRDHVAASQARLARTIASGKIRCARGISQYLEGGRTQI